MNHDIPKSVEIAAQIWCRPECRHLVMEPLLAFAFTEELEKQIEGRRKLVEICRMEATRLSEHCSDGAARQAVHNLHEATKDEPVKRKANPSAFVRFVGDNAAGIKAATYQIELPGNLLALTQEQRATLRKQIASMYAEWTEDFDLVVLFDDEINPILNLTP